MKLINLAKTVAEISVSNLNIFLKKEKLSFDETVTNGMAMIKEQGYCLVHDFIDSETCGILIKDIDKMLEAYDHKIWKDELGADKRAFGADKVSEAIKQKFYYDPFIIAAREAYYQVSDKYILGCTMANRIVTKEGNLGSGGGWHRDSVNKRQFKAILYLTDVSANNGAFQYITGTQHKETVIEGIIKHGFDHNHNRFTQVEINKILSNSKHEIHTLTGKAGTLILVDTSGIQRGSPLKKAVRYALTNYYFLSKEKGGKGFSDKIAEMLIK